MPIRYSDSAKDDNGAPITGDNGEPEDSEPRRPMFRGFIGGDSFCTKQGYRGLRLDSMWVQNIFDSFETDDDELATIALQSQLADLKDMVIGGYEGSAFSIGDFGFYAENQFETQARFLTEEARRKAVGKNYLSVDEWEVVDARLTEIAHHGKARFRTVTRGDSFATLAIRESAFRVAKVFMDAGIDPLMENEDGDDMFQTVKQQYQFLVQGLKEIQDFKMQAKHVILVPSTIEGMIDKENRTLQQFNNLAAFATSVEHTLHTRLKGIEHDLVLQRRCMLRNLDFPADKKKNIAQKDKVEKYIEEIEQLKFYIDEKLRHHEIHGSQLESLTDVLSSNLDLIFPTADEETLATAGMSSQKFVTEDNEFVSAAALITTSASAAAADDDDSTAQSVSRPTTADYSDKQQLLLLPPIIEDQDKAARQRSTLRQQSVRSFDNSSVDGRSSISGSLRGNAAAADYTGAISRQNSYESQTSRGSVMGILGSRSSSKYSNLADPVRTQQQSRRDVDIRSDVPGSSAVSTPRTARTVDSAASSIASSSYYHTSNNNTSSRQQQKSQPRLQSKQELYDKLGINNYGTNSSSKASKRTTSATATTATTAESPKRTHGGGSFAAAGSLSLVSTTSRTSNAGTDSSGQEQQSQASRAIFSVEKAQKKDNYTPVIGTLKESDHEVVMYR